MPEANPHIKKVVLSQSGIFGPSEIKSLVWRELNTADPRNYVRNHIKFMLDAGEIELVRRGGNRKESKYRVRNA